MGYENYGPPWGYIHEKKKRKNAQQKIEDLQTEIKELKKNILSSEKIKQIENELIAEIHEQLERNERINMEQNIREELTLQITKEVWEKTREVIEEFKIKEQKNLSVFLPNLKIIIDEADYSNIDMGIEEFVKKRFENMGYEVELTLDIGYGHPDMICRKGIERIYIEVKSYRDGLRMNQAKWIVENKDKNFIIYYVKKLRKA